jgi:hypothetical protein
MKLDVARLPKYGCPSTGRFRGTDTILVSALTILAIMEISLLGRRELFKRARQPKGALCSAAGSLDKISMADDIETIRNEEIEKK